MLKYILPILLGLTVSAHAEPQVINYVSPTQPALGGLKGPYVKNVFLDNDTMMDLDRTGAMHGDPHAMGSLALSCLAVQDFECAYLWSGIALRSSYWQQNGKLEKIREIQEKAREHLSENIVAELDVSIKNFRPK